MHGQPHISFPSANSADSFIQWQPPIQPCTKSISERVVKESVTLNLKGNSVLELKDHATKVNGKVELEFQTICNVGIRWNWLTLLPEKELALLIN